MELIQKMNFKKRDFNKKIINVSIFFLVIFLVLLLPNVYSLTTIHPYEWSKILLLRFFTFVIGALWLFKILFFDENHKLSKKWTGYLDEENLIDQLEKIKK